jgi:uncharacterized membrane protein
LGSGSLPDLPWLMAMYIGLFAGAAPEVKSLSTSIFFLFRDGKIAAGVVSAASTAWTIIITDATIAVVVTFDSIFKIGTVLFIQSLTKM